MKRLLFLVFMFLSFSAFAQIDSSAWEGKTVLMVTNDTLLNTYQNNSWIKTKPENWYLTDSVCAVSLSVLNRALNDFGADTIVFLWEANWQKTFTDKGCMSANPNECLSWILVESYKFRNFQSGKWETYIFPFYDKEQNNLKKTQDLITNLGYKPTYEDKTKIIRNPNWSKDIETIINQKFQDTALKVEMNFWNKYANYNRNDAIYIYQRNYPPTNYIEKIDLQTNRVIEKIKIKIK